MRHLRMVGLCLVAAFAIAAVAATSASALPEWGQCFKKGPGSKYTDSNCTKKSSLKTPGEFEWRKGTEIAPSEKHFAGAGGVGILSGEYRICRPSEKVRKPKCNAGEEEGSFAGGPLNVECESEAAHGEASGSKGVANVSVVFRGCKVFGSSPCSNTEKAGEIRVNPLKGTLGYISKATKDVGVLLEPVVKKGRFATFGCLEGQITTVVGVGNEKEGAAYSPEKTGGFDGIISPITPVNTMTKELTQVYTINANQENVPSKFEGKHIELLESYLYNAELPEYTTKWSKAGESVTNVNTQEGGAEVEIKA
jgi:hypothetical protein